MILKVLKPSQPGCALAVVFMLASGVGASAQTQAPPAAAPSAQEKPAEAPLPAAQAIIDRHIAAAGGREAIQARNSVSFKGSVSIPANGMTGTVEVFAARPNKQLSKMNLSGIGDVSEGYDGTVAWSMSPMTGPMLATGEELAQKAFNADFDGTLGVAQRYDAIKTLERTTFEGRPVYKIALTRKGGGDVIEFYDVETGLKAGGIMDVKSPMGTIPVTSAVSEYKKFGALLQPTIVKQTMSGAQIVMTFTSVEYDKVDPAVFELPAPIKALVK